MSNTWFAFKQFTIHHDRCAMKVGTDGVLLGAWASKLKINPKYILDIGTGSGLIAIMLAQSYQAIIDAIDLDEQACEQAIENVQSSPWSKHIRVKNLSFQDFFKKQQQHYDLLVCNPPFFSKSLKPDNKQRSIARHNDTLSLKDLLDGAQRLLASDGLFCMILPQDTISKLYTIADSYKLYPQQLLAIRSRAEQTVSRLLIALGRKKTPCQESSLFISKQDGEYSQAYQELTADYYLNF